MMGKSPDLQKKLPQRLADLSRTLATLIQKNGGHFLIVGGAVRDLLIEKTPHEIDAEVRGLRT